MILHDGTIIWYFSCDDSARRSFLTNEKLKGSIGGPGQSNSNLWFTSLTQPDSLGPVTAEGAVWLKKRWKLADSQNHSFLPDGRNVVRG